MNWRTVLSWEVKPEREKPWEDPKKVKAAVKKILDGYEMLGQKARKSDLIRDVANELRGNYFTPGIREAVEAELRRRGWSFGNFDDM